MANLMQKSKKLTTPEIVYAFLTHYAMFHPFHYPTRWSKLLFGAPPPCRELSYVVLMPLSTSVRDADKLIRSQRQVINLQTVQRPKPKPKEELQSIHSEGSLLAFGSFCALWHVEMLLKPTSFNCQTRLCTTLRVEVEEVPEYPANVFDWKAAMKLRTLV